MCSYVLSPSVTPCSFRCPRDSSRRLLVIYLQHGPRGLRVGPRRRAHRHLVFPRARAPLTYDVPNTRLQGVLLLIDIIDFFLFFLSSFLFPFTHFTGSARPLALSSSSSSIPPAPYFGISRETGSSRSSSAAFEQLPDPSRDFIRAMRSYSRAKRIIYIRIQV